MADNAASIGAVLYVSFIILTRYVTQAKNAAKAAVRLPRPKSFLLSEKTTAVPLTDKKGCQNFRFCISWSCSHVVRICCNFLNYGCPDNNFVNFCPSSWGSRTRQGWNIRAGNNSLCEGQHRRRCIKLTAEYNCLHYMRMPVLTVCLTVSEEMLNQQTDKCCFTISDPNLHANPLIFARWELFYMISCSNQVQILERKKLFIPDNFLQKVIRSFSSCEYDVAMHSVRLPVTVEKKLS